MVANADTYISPRKKCAIERGTTIYLLQTAHFLLVVKLLPINEMDRSRPHMEVLSMGNLPGERRTARRYDLRLTLRYRVSEKGATPVTGTGITCDLSTDGVAFRCRRSLPLGAHVELLVDWPSRQGNQFPIELQLTGFIVRTGGGRNGVRVTSRKFRVDSDTSLLATAS